jgi:hypothetical protein
MLSKDMKIRIYKCIILPVVFYGCRNLSPQREEHRPRVFENRVLRYLVLEVEEKCIIRSFITYILHQV